MAAPKNKGLQKLPVSDKKLQGLLRRDRTTREDINKLTQAEKVRLGEISTELIRRVSPDQRDKLMEKMKDIIAEQTITEMWEYNHFRIIYAISSYIDETSVMPTRTQIAERANVSRTTVFKHLKGYSEHPLYLEQLQKLRLLSTNVLAKVYQTAMAGDTGSQKLYFNVMGMLGNNQGGPLVQNNYIQINGIVLSQDMVKKLNSEQLTILENVLKTVIPIEQSNIKI